MELLLRTAALPGAAWGLTWRQWVLHSLAIHCLTSPGQWAVEILFNTASPPGGSGQWNSCNAPPHAPPHCMWAVGSGTLAIHYRTARGQWAVELSQCTAPLPGGRGASELVQRTASLHGGSGQCMSCIALSHCLGAVGSGIPAMHCLTAGRQWVVQLLQCTAAPPGGSRQCNSCNALPHRLGAVGSATPATLCLTALGTVGSGTPATHCRTAWGQWAVKLLQYIASLPGGSGQWDFCNAPPHHLGALGSGTPATHCLTAWGHWAVELLQRTASRPGGSEQWNSCYTLPHCLEAVGSGTPTSHCLTA